MHKMMTPTLKKIINKLMFCMRKENTFSICLNCGTSLTMRDICAKNRTIDFNTF